MPQAKILVIEDDDDIAKLEQTVLERADYEVKVTGTGAEGLELARAIAAQGRLKEAAAELEARAAGDPALAETFLPAARSLRAQLN